MTLENDVINAFAMVFVDCKYKKLILFHEKFYSYNFPILYLTKSFEFCKNKLQSMPNFFLLRPLPYSLKNTLRLQHVGIHCNVLMYC